VTWRGSGIDRVDARLGKCAQRKVSHSESANGPCRLTDRRADTLGSIIRGFDAPVFRRWK